MYSPLAQGQVTAGYALNWLRTMRDSSTSSKTSNACNNARIWSQMMISICFRIGRHKILSERSLASRRPPCLRPRGWVVGERSRVFEIEDCMPQADVICKCKSANSSMSASVFFFWSSGSLDSDIWAEFPYPQSPRSPLLRDAERSGPERSTSPEHCSFSKSQCLAKPISSVHFWSLPLLPGQCGFGCIVLATRRTLEHQACGRCESGPRRCRTHSVRAPANP